MPEDLNRLLEILEKPLNFASKENFRNLSKLKSPENIIEDICIKLLSQTKNPELLKVLKSIQEYFIDFDNKSRQDKIVIINSALSNISKLKAETFQTLNIHSKSSDSTKNEINPGDPVRFLKGVGPRISELLSKKDIKTVEDLLFYFPRKYEDRRNIKKISMINKPERVVVFGEIIDLNVNRLRAKKIYNVVVSDGTGALNLVWFSANETYLKKTYLPGAKIVVSGDVSYNKYNKNLQIIHPKPEDVEIYTDLEDIENSTNVGRIVPIYPLTEGLTQKRLRTIIKVVVEQLADKLENVIPEEIIRNYKLSNMSTAIKEVQFPEVSDTVVNLDSSSDVYNSIYHKTVSFYEFFLLEIGLMLKKKEYTKKSGISFKTGGVLVTKFIKSLPFKMTNAQQKAVYDIENDMKGNFPMNRLLQGDVGSGKTVVSIVSMLNAVDDGYQAVLMAPTEILCEQHYLTLTSMLNDMDIKIVLLKSAIKSKQKKEINRMIKDGEANIVVGTHALIQEDVKFKNLGLAVIDEQHRFGVLQRAKLMNKGANPDVLVMTATPIPRTLAITVYGDLDVSIIDELPPGRKRIKTKLFKDNKKSRSEIYSTIRSELDKGRQCYVVCPFIDESENQDFQHINYATKVFDTLKNEIFPEYTVGLMHGRMENEEKEDVMKQFVANKLQILVSTTVIEVGVDVPNATIMLIENSERYGLSQLHQLRGRIGRGSHVSSCILVADYALSENAGYKLDIMTKTNDGFKISEADLKLRGPGDFLGTKQSGIPTFNFADLIRDWKILSEARESAMNLINSDPELTGSSDLKKIVEKRWGQMLELNLIS